MGTAPERPTHKSPQQKETPQKCPHRDLPLGLSDQRTSGPKQAWILDDKKGFRQQAAVEAGAAVLKCARAFDMCGKTQLDHAAFLLQQQAPHILWIRLFEPHTPRGNRQDRLGLRAVVRFMSLQIAQQRDVVLEATPKQCMS